jgi:hypothetical protein
LELDILRKEGKAMKKEDFENLHHMTSCSPVKLWWYSSVAKEDILSRNACKKIHLTYGPQ